MGVLLAAMRRNAYRGFSAAFYMLLTLSACSIQSATASSPSFSCSIATPIATQNTSTTLPGLTFSLPGHPYSSVITHNGQWIFVSLDALTSSEINGIAVLHRNNQSIQLVQTVTLPYAPNGLALTHDDSLLLVADSVGIALIDATKAEQQGQAAFFGSVFDAGSNPGTVAVTLSRDEHYAYASDEHNNAISVIDVQQARTQGMDSSALINQIPVDYGPGGMAISPDNKYLYVTSRIRREAINQPDFYPSSQMVGTLSVIDTTRAVHDPAHAVVARVLAGCNPVNIVLSTRGDTAWVVAQGSNMLLAFNTLQLPQDAQHALLASVSTGLAPISAVLINNDTVLAVTNSNSLLSPQSPQTIVLYDTKLALSGQPALLRLFRAGAYPRELALSADQRVLLLTNYNSETLNIVDVGTLPRPNG